MVCRVKRVTSPVRLASTLGVEITDEINLLAGKIRQQRGIAFAGQCGDQIRLARLAGAKHAGAHRPLHCLIESFSLGDQTAKFLGQTRFFLSHPFVMFGQPVEKPSTNVFKFMAPGAKLVAGSDSPSP